MDELFNNKYRVPSARLTRHDYAGTGDYFITICVNLRLPAFGNLNPPIMNLNPLGQIAHQFWSEIPLHYPNMSVDEFVIMPDHMHGLISLNQIVDTPRRLENLASQGTGRDVALQRLFHANAPPPVAAPPNPPIDPSRMRAQSPLPGSIPAAVRSYKAAVKRWANQNGYAGFAWQERYWDSIVRDDEGLARVRAYIRNNPRKGHTVDGNGDDA